MSDVIETRDITKEGITYRVRVHYDPDTTPFEADCYDPWDINAWINDEWRYVYITVTPLAYGEEITGSQASLGGTEYGMLPGNNITIDTLCESHPVPELIDEARDNLQAWLKSVRGN